MRLVAPRLRPLVLLATLAGAGPACALAAEAGGGAVQFQGDFRMRYDRRDTQTAAGSSHLVRERARLRAGATWDAASAWRFGARVRTRASTPTSGDVDWDNLRHDAAALELGFDQLYVRWQPTPRVTLWSGKVPNPFLQNNLLWDRDYHPEGLVQLVRVPARGGGIERFATAGEFLLRRFTDGNRPMLFAAQAGLRQAARAAAPAWQLALGYHGYENLADTIIPNGYRANSRDARARLTADFRIATFYADADFKPASWRVRPVLEYARNLAVVRKGTGWEAGVRFAPAKSFERLNFGWSYRRLERNCTLDAFAESSWHALRAGYAGHQFSARWVARKNWQFTGRFSLLRTVAGPRNDQTSVTLQSLWTL